MTAALGAVREAAAAEGLRVRRAWPRSECHLLLDLTGADGSVAGQWFDAPDTAADVAAATPGARLLRTGNASARLVLQPGGADRKLKALARLLIRPELKLVSHRPERRAVVQLAGDSPGFREGGTASRLAGSGTVRAGRAVARCAPPWCSDARNRAVVTGPLAGRPLPACWPERAHDACRGREDIGRSAPIDPVGSSVHGAGMSGPSPRLGGGGPGARGSAG